MQGDRQASGGAGPESSLGLSDSREPARYAAGRGEASAAHHQERPGAKAATLGDLLYADKAEARVSEREWIELVRRIATGDQLALHALYDRTHRVVFTLIMRICRIRETAEEVTLDVFLEVWRRGSHYDSANGTVLGWVMNLARSRAIDRLRFDQRRKRVDPHPDDAPAEQDTSDCLDMVELKDRSRALKAALTVLTPDERHAIETAFFSELTYAEVAARLNQPLGTIKTRIRSGLHKLRRELAAELRR